MKRGLELQPSVVNACVVNVCVVNACKKSPTPPPSSLLPLPLFHFLHPPPMKLLSSEAAKTQSTVFECNDVNFSVSEDNDCIKGSRGARSESTDVTLTAASLVGREEEGERTG